MCVSGSEGVDECVSVGVSENVSQSTNVSQWETNVSQWE